MNRNLCFCVYVNTLEHIDEALDCETTSYHFYLQLDTILPGISVKLYISEVIWLIATRICFIYGHNITIISAIAMVTV